MIFSRSLIILLFLLLSQLFSFLVNLLSVPIKFLSLFSDFYHLSDQLMVLFLVHCFLNLILFSLIFFVCLILSLVLIIIRLSILILLWFFRLFLCKYSECDEIESVPENIANKLLVYVRLYQSFVCRLYWI